MTKPKIREDKYTLYHKLPYSNNYNLFIYFCSGCNYFQRFLEISAIDYQKATSFHSLLP